MKENLQESDNNKVALFFKKVLSIIWEIVITILTVAFLVYLCCLVLGNYEELQKAITFKPAVGDRVLGLFSVYVAVSLGIESAVEIYLKVFRGSKSSVAKEKQDNNQASKDPKIKRIATIASLIVGIAVKKKSLFIN